MSNLFIGKHQCALPQINLTAVFFFCFHSIYIGCARAHQATERASTRGWNITQFRITYHKVYRRQASFSVRASSRRKQTMIFGCSNTVKTSSGIANNTHWLIKLIILEKMALAVVYRARCSTSHEKWEVENSTFAWIENEFASSAMCAISQLLSAMATVMAASACVCYDASDVIPIFREPDFD